jgi:hypothetical protein
MVLVVVVVAVDVGAALGQGCVDLLPDEGVAKGVVADGRTSKAHAAKKLAAALDSLEAREVFQQQRVVSRQPARTWARRVPG